MKKITNKHKKILSLLNSFGYLSEEFFRIVFHNKSTLSKDQLNYKVSKSVAHLININFIEKIKSPSGIYYTILPNGKTYLYNNSETIFNNSERLDSGKFFHSQYCSLVYASLSAKYQVEYKTEKSLNRAGNLKVVPDLAIRINNTVLYFEVERSLKSQDLIKEKLINYNTYFGSGYLIYLTGNKSIVNKVNKLKVLYKNTNKIYACDIMDFINDPSEYLASWGIEGSHVTC